MKYLAIDYGTKRIGLALSYGNIAEPLRIIPHDAAVFTTLVDLIAREGVDAIVLGISDREMAEKTRAFSHELSHHIDLPITFFDESFSSVAVHDKMIASHMKQSSRSQHIDHFAAAHFLQEYLDTVVSDQ